MSEDGGLHRVRAEELEGLVAAIFAAAGCSGAEAARIADGLVGANLTGHESHGVARVPRYLEWLRTGEVEADQTAEVVSDAGGLAVIDGRYGFGATVGREAVEFGITRAQETGSAIVGLRRAGHLGRIGQWAERAAEAGLVSIHLVNVAGSTLVAPFGGVDRRFSTAPIAFGFPVPDEPPVILDFATSLVAEGKVLVASQGGKALPDGSLIDPDGRLSSDPTTLYGALAPGGPRDHRRGLGAIRTMGDHKGSGLALMCELVAGALTGSGCAGPPRGQRFANGMVSIYLAPASFGSTEEFETETREFLDFVRASRPAEPGGAVLLPGEPERHTRSERLRHGIPLSAETWAALRSIAAGLEVDDSVLAEA
ncbi:MAG: malate/lactate/ureidoglycolate dehydrogenase [Methylobacteriaceae bacterium]|nr:malate/lactate/ureidoglycolate dehydrogenase [Methylobacteriaceae bacterium]